MSPSAVYSNLICSKQVPRACYWGYDVTNVWLVSLGYPLTPPWAPGLWVSHHIIITPRLLMPSTQFRLQLSIKPSLFGNLLLNVGQIKTLTIRHNQCHIIQHQWPRVTGAGHGIMVMLLLLFIRGPAASVTWQTEVRVTPITNIGHVSRTHRDIS